MTEEPEKNQRTETEVEVEETSKTVEAGSERAEATFENVFLAGEDNRGKFEKLSDSAKGFAGRLYEGAKMNTIDRARIMFNDKLFERHREKSVLLKFQSEEKEKNIQRSEELKAGYGGRLTSIQQELGPISPKLLAKAELETEEIQKNIDKEKGKMEDLERQLNYRNEKGKTYETKRNRLCEGIIEKTNEKLEPYEKKIEALKGNREQLGLKIDSFRDKNKEFSAKIKDLEGRMKAAPLKIERTIYRSYLKEFKKVLKENEKLINKTINKEAKIGHQVAKFEKKAGPWQSKRDQLKRMMGRGAEEPGKKSAKEVPVPQSQSAGQGEPDFEILPFSLDVGSTEEQKEEELTWHSKSISKGERRFWIDKLGGKAKNLFEQYKGDFEELAKRHSNKQRYVEAWKKIKKERT